jgi:peroxiredoxin
MIAQVSAAAGIPVVPVGNRSNGSAPSANSLPSTVLSVGVPAPAFALPDLRGSTVRLEDYRGRETLLLFWNPHCGYCKQMLAGLKAWESVGPERALRLLVVSTGSVEHNRAMDLAASVVLDPEQRVGNSLGIRGTPSAVLIDGEGAVASDIAVGAAAIFTLAGNARPPSRARLVPPGTGQ